ncbi:MAG: DUF4179 domain-containing protein [Oscillospiraceae bacterium]|nr:DUF4179 domain-containing protein [Oscillospiraceae bacterium]
MNPMELLNGLEDIREEYIVSAGVFRQGRRHLPFRKIWLLAAVIALMLLLVGCVAYSQGWFVQFFSARSEEPLTDSQIALIQEKEQQIGETETQNGWTVELRSSIWDGNKAYVILGVTAPEGTDLEPDTIDGAYIERFTFYREGWPIGILEYPKGVKPYSEGMTWEEDGDGKDHTKNAVLEITPDTAGSSVDPFGPESVWGIRFDQIVRCYDDVEYRQHLLDTKYKDAYGVMFTTEEIGQIQQEEVLAEGDWSFSFTFAGTSPQTGATELLTAPMPLEVDVLRRYGDLIWESAHFREEIVVTSVQLQPLSVRIGYEDCNGSPILWFSDENLFVEEDIYTSVVMRDGSSIAFWPGSSGWDGQVLLEAPAPILWEEAAYICFADGTRLHMDGTWERGQRKQQPAAATAYRDIDCESGVYAYYADFDGDELEDMAIWYDGAFHNLCLLDEKGECRREFIFENGMDVYETYNQRSEEISWEPNLIRILGTDGDTETTYFYWATADALELAAAVKQNSETAEDYFLIGNGETEVRVSREEFRAVIEDFQVMQYRLRPVR